MFENEELQCEDKCKLPNLKLDWVQQFQEKSQTAQKDCQRFNAWRRVLFLDGSLFNLPRFCELLCARALREIHGKLYNVVDLITTPSFYNPFIVNVGIVYGFVLPKYQSDPFIWSPGVVSVSAWALVLLRSMVGAQLEMKTTTLPVTWQDAFRFSRTF